MKSAEVVLGPPTQVNALNDEFRKYLSEPHWLGLPNDMSARVKKAFGQCIGKIHAVPVRGSPEPSFVLEIDVTPDTYICRDLVFSYRDLDDGNKVVSTFRQQASNIDLSKAGKDAVRDATDWRTSQQEGHSSGGKSHAQDEIDAVMSAAEWRTRQELRHKKSCFQEEADQLSTGSDVLFDGMVEFIDGKIAEVCSCRVLITAVEVGHYRYSVRSTGI